MRTWISLAAVLFIDFRPKWRIIACFYFGGVVSMGINETITSSEHSPFIARYFKIKCLDRALILLAANPFGFMYSNSRDTSSTRTLVHPNFSAREHQQEKKVCSNFVISHIVNRLWIGSASSLLYVAVMLFWDGDVDACVATRERRR